MSLFTKLFGTKSERELKKNQPLVKAILAKDEEYSALTNEELRGKTDELRARLANGATIDDNDMIIEAFAAAREATWRALEKKPFEVQVVGGLVLHQGRIAEMKTGEGKTITAVMPAYLNALTGNPVHIVTVNDYLAKFQGEMMSKVFRMLGMTTGIILRELTPSQRRAAYACDVTYATNNELGFDYLRDNMTLYQRDMVQRGHAFAIVDEVDSILVDEARTPLIISGRGDKSTDMYEKADRFVAGLRCTKVKELEDKQLQEDLDGDYVVDEKARSASLLPSGVEKAEKAFGVDNLTDPENSELYHHINQAIRARGVMVRDVDYVVQNGQVIIVDEFTGRLMIGRRYNEGLHQAIEAKEGVKVESENKTVA
ncbi:MAG: preprotein translocase subunit SecA, partial [Clostridia bacterium]|nr:preprotein translocase subunit SecA [Clostridia bacterium]